MSTSPRIDALLGHLAEQGRELCESSCPQALVDEARRIEVELGDANARIKRLEEAGDTLSWYSTSKAREEWVKAKESKP